MSSYLRRSYPLIFQVGTVLASLAIALLSDSFFVWVSMAFLIAAAIFEAATLGWLKNNNCHSPLTKTPSISQGFRSGFAWVHFLPTFARNRPYTVYSYNIIGYVPMQTAYLLIMGYVALASIMYMQVSRVGSVVFAIPVITNLVALCRACCQSRLMKRRKQAEHNGRTFQLFRPWSPKEGGLFSA